MTSPTATRRRPRSSSATGVQWIKGQVQLWKADPEALSTRELKQLVRTAQQLRRCDLLPGNLTEQTAQACSPNALTSENSSTTQQDPAISESLTCLAAKSETTRISFKVLLRVYQRGVIEYERLRRAKTMIPVGASQFAQARVNTFIRLVDGDPDARDDDKDLLASARHSLRG